MEALGCIKTRASVRSFRPDDVPEGLVNEILEAAIEAPSAGNVQDWHFVIVRNAGNRKRLAEAAFAQDFIAGAPVVIVACADLRDIGGAYGERGQGLYSVQDAAAATENLMLAAWAKGIGSCWVGSFNEKKVRDIIVLPGHVRPMAIIPLGYPASAPRKPARKKLSEVIHREYY
jgi:nitroreductase